MVAPGSASAPLTSVACDEAEGGDIAGKGTVFSPAGDGAAGCVTTEGPAASVCTVSASADGVAGGCGTKAGASVCVAWEGAAGSAIAGVVGASVSAAPAVGSSMVAACGEVDTGCVDNGDAAPARKARRWSRLCAAQCPWRRLPPTRPRVAIEPARAPCSRHRVAAPPPAYSPKDWHWWHRYSPYLPQPTVQREAIEPATAPSSRHRVAAPPPASSPKDWH